MDKPLAIKEATMNFQVILEWISTNKDWIFDGVGVAVLIFLANMFFKKKNETSIKQTQISGNNSVNNQSAGSITSNVTIGRNDKNV